MSGTSGSACFSLERDARGIFQQALRGCSIERALDMRLHAGDVDTIYPAGATVCVRGVRRILLVAMGKGAAGMLWALLRREDIAGGRALAGVLVAPERPEWLPASIEYIRGGHPTPDAESRRAAERILQMLRGEPESAETLCFFLISGGASAMVELPLDRSIGVGDTAAFHRALVHSGRSIVDINVLRRHFSAVKGGRLALAAAHLRTVTLLMSDVPGDRLDVIASGPTLPDGSTVADCRRLLAKGSLYEELPGTVRAFFDRTDLPETPKPSALVPRAVLLLSEADLAEAAAGAARERGYTAVADNTPDDWPADEAAAYLLERFRTLRREHGHVCLISTGELTVKVPASLQGRAMGGRNQHFVLECAARFRAEDHSLAVLSCGSDGMDGNSTAAGAVLGSENFRSEEAQRRARETLLAFESNALLRRMGAAIETGPTGLNLRDLRLLLG